MTKKTSNSLLVRAKREGTPLIDGDRVTFVWEGETAPYVIGDFNGWGWTPNPPISEKTMTRVSPKSDVWTLTITLPQTAYIEYIFQEDLSDHKTRLNDPLNKRRVSNGMRKFNNYFDMPDVTHTPLVKTTKRHPAGMVTHHRITDDFFMPDNGREVWLYQPPVDEAVPLVLVFDGKDYYRRAKITTIIDNLIAENRMRPVALALVQHAGRGRFVEYAPSEAALANIERFVMPLAHEHLNLIDPATERGAYGVLGASLGGLMALYTGLRLPHIFGRVMSQSGAFQISYMGADTITKLLLEHLPPQPLKIWQDVGRYEWLMGTNREVNALLRRRGYEVTYQEFDGGHNYTAWRDMLPQALITMYGK